MTATQRERLRALLAKYRRWSPKGRRRGERLRDGLVAPVTDPTLLARVDDRLLARIDADLAAGGDPATAFKRALD